MDIKFKKCSVAHLALFLMFNMLWSQLNWWLKKLTQISVPARCSIVMKIIMSWKENQKSIQFQLRLDVNSRVLVVASSSLNCLSICVCLSGPFANFSAWICRLCFSMCPFSLAFFLVKVLVGVKSWLYQTTGFFMNFLLLMHIGPYWQQLYCTLVACFSCLLQCNRLLLLLFFLGGGGVSGSVNCTRFPKFKISVALSVVNIYLRI